MPSLIEMALIRTQMCVVGEGIPVPLDQFLQPKEQFILLVVLGRAYFIFIQARKTGEARLGEVCWEEARSRERSIRT